MARYTVHRGQRTVLMRQEADHDVVLARSYTEQTEEQADRWLAGKGWARNGPWTAAGTSTVVNYLTNGSEG